MYTGMKARGFTAEHYGPAVSGYRFLFVFLNQMLPHQPTPLCVYLVVVVMAMKEGLLPEDHASQHTTQAPHIQTVVIHLKHTEHV